MMFWVLLVGEVLAWGGIFLLLWRKFDAIKTRHVIVQRKLARIEDALDEVRRILTGEGRRGFEVKDSRDDR